MELVTTYQISRALAKKHAEHVFFQEVKNGPSWNSHLRIMDAMAILPSWSPITIIGYEIKSSRSDFLNDTKWPEYLSLCHQFVWVCPKGLIKPEEVGPNCGLMYCSATGHLLTKKRPVYRQIELPTKMLMYLLLWRGDKRSSQARADILRDMADDRELGDRYRRFVSAKLSAANEALARAKHYDHEHADIMKLCDELGVSKYELVDLLKTAKAFEDIDKVKRQIAHAFAALNSITLPEELRKEQACTPF